MAATVKQKQEALRYAVTIEALAKDAYVTYETNMARYPKPWEELGSMAHTSWRAAVIELLFDIDNRKRVREIFDTETARGNSSEGEKTG